MNTQHNIEERLWEYIDGLSSPEEKSFIEELLQTDAEWKAKYSELLDINNLVKTSELEAPSMRFTKNVMEEISKLHIAPATKNYINKKVIWGIGIFFILMFTGFIIYAFSQISLHGGQETDISKNITKNIGNVDFSKIFNNNWVNAFMLVNVVIGLVLLDNYFSSKKKDFRKQA